MKSKAKPIRFSATVILDGYDKSPMSLKLTAKFKQSQRAEAIRYFACITKAIEAAREFQN